MGHRPKVLIHRAEIARTVRSLAGRIQADYAGKNPVLIGALKGCFVFMSDLVRALDIPLTVDFLGVFSYAAGTESSGTVRLLHDFRNPVQGRHVVVVEDIVDTGCTLAFILEHLKTKSPASIRVCALLDKPSRRRVPVSIDYLGFTVPNRFIVGYGLDFDEYFRNLPDLCVLEEDA